MNPLIISRWEKKSPTRDMLTRLCIGQDRPATLVAWWSQEQYEEGFKAPVERLFDNITVVFLCQDEFSTEFEGYIRAEAWTRRIPVYSVQ